MQVNAFPIAEVVVDVVVAEKNSLDTTAGGKRFEARPVSLSKQTSSFFVEHEPACKDGRFEELWQSSQPMDGPMILV
jgi:hypothetical protein